MAVPGFLLSGWAPARASPVPVRIAIRDIAGDDDEALRQGVAFGMLEVAEATRLTRTPVIFQRFDTDEHEGDPDVEVVVSAHDDRAIALALGSGLTRIHTCPLREWRADAWSVASGPASGHGIAAERDWHPRLTHGGAAQLNARFRRHAGKPMDESAWRGWMAVKVAYEAALRARAGERDLLALEFDGYKGRPLRFGDDGHLRQPTFRTAGDTRVIVVPPRLDLGDAFA